MTRRELLCGLPAASLAGVRSQAPPLALFVAGDVMTGRAIDQILPHPSDPRLEEPFMRSALGYLRLAERAGGPIFRPVDFAYIWGDALGELERRKPDWRIVNLETTITTSNDFAPKGINYRMHPKNAATLTAARIDCAVLANNHILDFGVSGLAQTLETLAALKIRPAGAGRNLGEAQAPAVLERPGRPRVLVFGFATPGAGVPPHWAAAETRPGVNFLPNLSAATARAVAAQIRAWRRPQDVVVVSIHWGANWGYRVPREHQEFARRLIDEAEVDLIHGHSSHHPIGIEVYRGRPVLYGCGDFINDYEGIEGYEEFRPHLVLMYFVTLEAASRRLLGLEMTPLRIRRLRLERARREEAVWLRNMFTREGRMFNTFAELHADLTLALGWREVSRG